MNQQTAETPNLTSVFMHDDGAPIYGARIVAELIVNDGLGDIIKPLENEKNPANRALNLFNMYFNLVLIKCQHQGIQPFNIDMEEAETIAAEFTLADVRDDKNMTGIKEVGDIMGLSKRCGDASHAHRDHCHPPYKREIDERLPLLIESLFAVNGIKIDSPKDIHYLIRKYGEKIATSLEEELVGRFGVNPDEYNEKPEPVEA